MVGVMVRHQQRFAKNGLPVAPGNLCKQICPRALHQFRHGVQAAVKPSHTFFPSRFPIRRFRIGPIAFGEFRGHVPGAVAEFHNIPLRNPQVLQQLPCSVRKAGHARPAQLRRETANRRVEVHVRAASFEEIDDVPAQAIVIVRRSFLALALHRTFPYFTDRITCPGDGGIGWIVLEENPAFRNIFSYSGNVYASPWSVAASMVRLNFAATAGVTRSSLGTNSSVTARAPGFNAAFTLRSNFSFVAASKWWRKFVSRTTS